MRAFLGRFDVRISLAYGIIAALWIVLSDSAMALIFAANPSMLAVVSVYKGLGYVLVTSLALFLLLRAELRKRDRAERALQEDIVERKKIEAALRESEHRFRNLADTAPALIWTTDSTDQVTFLSRGWYHFTGQHEANSLGQAWLDALHPEDREHVRVSFLDNIKTREYFQVEYQLHSPIDNAQRWVIATGTPRWSEDGVFQGYIGSVIDVTERRRAQQEMQAAAILRTDLEKEKELLQLKERFISVVSHEFRTPLSVIYASAELMHRYRDRIAPDRQDQHMRDILSQTEYMVDLLDDVLLVNIAQSGRLEFNPSPLDVVIFCETAIERMQVIDRGKHNFCFTHTGDLRSAALDAKLLQHILSNLLSNAIKYSPDGGDVRLDVCLEQGDVVLRVSDQGIGIPAESLPYLYEPFYRARNTGDIGGTGLGTAIVKESVDLHRGVIACESELGVGTTFTVRLPVTSRLQTDLSQP